MPMDVAMEMENANGAVADAVPEEESADPRQQDEVRDEDLDKKFNGERKTHTQFMKNMKTLYSAFKSTGPRRNPQIFMQAMRSLIKDSRGHKVGHNDIAGSRYQFRSEKSGNTKSRKTSPSRCLQGVLFPLHLVPSGSG